MKDAYYFSHDSNARNDQRLIKIRMKYGMEGYGVYFGIIEILREQENYALWKSDIESISFDLRTKIETVEDIIYNHGLFEWKFDNSKDEGYFYSESLKRRMERADAIREKRSYAGRMSAKARSSVEQVLNKKETSDKQEKKEKETKVSKEDKKKDLEVRKNTFATSVHNFKEFPEKMRKDFISYWVELNHSKTKMRFQMQKTFEIKRRLTTWKNNKFNSNGKSGKSTFMSDKDYDLQKKEQRRLSENAKIKEKFSHIFEQ